MRRIFSNTWLICFIATIVLFGNLYCSLSTNEPYWFQRSGSMLVLLGLLIAARRIIRLGKDFRNKDWNLPDETTEGKKVRLDDLSEYIVGPIVAILGTVIWGYGDLFFLYFT